MLEDLMAKLEPKEVEYRVEAFDRAHVGIDRASEIGGIPQDGRYPASKSYPQPPRSDGRRVDIEVWAGRAFRKNDLSHGAPKESPHGTRSQS
jgi:hypothetical protein